MKGALSWQHRLWINIAKIRRWLFIKQKVHFQNQNKQRNKCIRKITEKIGKMRNVAFFLIWVLKE